MSMSFYLWQMSASRKVNEFPTVMCTEVPRSGKPRAGRKHTGVEHKGDAAWRRTLLPAVNSGYYF